MDQLPKALESALTASAVGELGVEANAAVPEAPANRPEATAADCIAAIDAFARAFQAGTVGSADEFVAQSGELSTVAGLSAALRFEEHRLRRGQGQAVDIDDLLLDETQAENIVQIRLFEEFFESCLSPNEMSGERFGNYELLAPIAAGGMGVVHQARQLGAGRIVALKRLRFGLAAGGAERARFKAEVEALGRLRHENVVTLYDAGEIDGAAYFAMEYVAGGKTLADLCAAGPMNAGDAARLVKTLAQAVHVAHRQGIIHRDLKPGNILLQIKDEGSRIKDERSAMGDEGSGMKDEGSGMKDERSSHIPHLSSLIAHPFSLIPKVSDFGMARIVGDESGRTVTGEIFGTPAYMSPEQAAGKNSEVGPGSDVYALGAILYQLLTGAPPFVGASSMQTLRLVIETEPPTPSRVHRGVPRDLETIALVCLSKSPLERYQSAQALADDLERFLAGKPLQARRPSTVDRLTKWCRRNPKLLSAAAALMAALLVGLFFWIEASAARQMANVQEFYARASHAAETLADGAPGRSWSALDDLRAAANLPIVDRDVVRMRSLAATALATMDVRPTARLAKGMMSAAIAFSPNGRRLAIGEYQGLEHCSVLVYEQAEDPSCHCLTDAENAIRAKKALPGVRQAVPLGDVRQAVPSDAEPDAGGWKLLHRIWYATDKTDSKKTGVRALQFSPDNQWLALGTRNGELHVWDLANVESSHHWVKAHEQVISGLTVHPRGAVLVSCSHDEKFKAWRFPELTPLFVWPYAERRPGVRYHGKLTGARFNAAGDRLWLFCECWNMCESGTPFLPEEPPPEFPKFAIDLYGQGDLHPDGRSLAEGKGDRLFESASWDSDPYWQRTYANGESAHRGTIAAAAFDSAGAMLVSVGHDRTMRIWESCSGRCTNVIPAPGTGSLVAQINPILPALAVTGDAETTVYEIGGRDVQTFLGHSRGPITQFSISSDGGHLACAVQWPVSANSSDGRSGATVWNADDGRFLWEKKLDDGYTPENAVVFHPRSRELLWNPAPPMPVRCCLSESGQTATSPDIDNSERLRFSPNGSMLWAIERQPGKRLRCWQWPNDKVLGVWSNEWATEARGAAGLWSLAVGQNWVLAGSGDQHAKLIDSQTLQMTTEWDCAMGAVCAVALSPDETLAAAGTQAGGIVVAQIPSGEKTVSMQPHHAPVESIAFSPNGALLATGSADKTVRLWKVAGAKLEELVVLRMPEAVDQIAFFPDGKQLAVLVQRETAVRVWHLDRLRARLAEMGLDWSDE